jgi:hypothetical protein
MESCEPEAIDLRNHGGVMLDRRRSALTNRHYLHADRRLRTSAGLCRGRCWRATLADAPRHDPTNGAVLQLDMVPAVAMAYNGHRGSLNHNLLHGTGL